MKKLILNISLIALAVAILPSCRKQLDQEPSNGVRVENAFNTLADFEQNTRGMYYRMVHAEHYIGGSDEGIAWISSLDLMADNLISQQTGRGSQRTYARWSYVPTSVNPTFDECYGIIRAANAIIENKDKLAGTENFYGEALTTRAMVHFDLMRLYSKPMSGLQAAPESLGVPYVKTTDVEDRPSRGTVQQTYDNVVADLTEALNVINADNGVGRLNKTAVYALLSRVYLYGGEWQKCIDASTECLNLQNDPGSIAAFPAIWTDDSEDGVIFKVRFTEQDQGADGQIKVGVGYGQIVSGGIKSEWVVTKSLYDLYQSDDVRKDAYVTTTTFSGADYNAVIKHLQRTDGTPPQIVDVKYLRVAEVLLNRAEAYTMLGAGNDASALADLDALREQRYSSFTPGTETGQSLKDAISLERRLELAFEGDRWFDLKRKGLPVQRDNFGDFADGTGTPSPTPTLSASDFRWCLPLSLFDVQANTNLQQNPGYPN
ncbi:SusD family protein [compost metagenome]